MATGGTEAIQTPCPLHFVIIGAGLAGVGTALALSQVGHGVTILERAPELKQVGAGIQLSPNATRILAAWHVLPLLLPYAYQPTSGSLRSWRTGNPLAPDRPDRAAAVVRDFGYPHLVVHRADLLRCLVSAASKSPNISIRLGCDVARIDRAEAAVYLASGERVDAHVLLGADGERSLCREALLGRKDAPRPSGDVVFRIAVARADIAAREDSPAREIARPGAVNVWMGPGAHAVSYVLRTNPERADEQVLNVVLVKTILNQEEEDKQADIMYGAQQASLEEVRRAFDGWDPALQALLDVPGMSDCAKWHLMCTEIPERWWDGGSMAVIGDAAHSMPPFLAQGAAMAFEDAAVLGAVFGRVKARGEIGKALRVFEEVRRPRAVEVKRVSEVRKGMYAMEDGEKQRERDAVLARGYVVGSPDVLADPGFRRWLWGYDAAADGGRAWEESEV